MNLTDPLEAYKNWAINKQNSLISQEMQGFIPFSMQNAIELAEKNFSSQKNYSMNENDREILGRIFENTTKRYNLFTEDAKKNLDIFYSDGLGIEVAHQPKFLGGERFLFNKIGCGSSLATMHSKFFPYFYLADYDKVHSELIKTHFSLLNSPTGFPSSIPFSMESEYNQKSISDMPLPNEFEVGLILRSISDQYRFSISSSLKDSWQIKYYQERLESAISLMKLSYANSLSYPDWFMNIVGTLTNILGEQGYLFLTASDPELKKYFLPNYEYLLKNRNLYIKNYTEMRQKFISEGFNPSLREIDKHFVPFFYECQSTSCGHQRIHLSVKVMGNDNILYGKCPNCNTTIEFFYNPSNPDLSEIMNHLTPRVESRQFLVSKSIPTGIHVAGSGEARYYTMALPFLKKFDTQTILPVIYYYNKTVMNTFMTRNLEEELINAKIPGFLEKLKEVMKQLGQFNKLLKKTDNLDEYSSRRATSIDILTTQKRYMKELEQLCSEFSQNYPQNNETKLMSYYMSNFFGKITKERSGQEAVFHWLDLALKNGISHIFDDYKRIYRPWLTPGLELTY